MVSPGRECGERIPLTPCVYCGNVCPKCDSVRGQRDKPKCYLLYLLGRMDVQCASVLMDVMYFFFTYMITSIKIHMCRWFFRAIN